MYYVEKDKKKFFIEVTEYESLIFGIEFGFYFVVFYILVWGIKIGIEKDMSEVHKRRNLK